MNPFFNAMNGNRGQGVNAQNLQAQINRLKQMFADPNAAIQELMNSGRVTQEQYNRAVQMARQITGR